MGNVRARCRRNRRSERTWCICNTETHSSDDDDDEAVVAMRAFSRGKQILSIHRVGSIVGILGRGSFHGSRVPDVARLVPLAGQIARRRVNVPCTCTVCTAISSTDTPQTALNLTTRTGYVRMCVWCVKYKVKYFRARVCDDKETGVILQRASFLLLDELYFSRQFKS